MVTSSGTYLIAVSEYSTSTDWDIELFSFTHTFQTHNVPESSLLIPADAIIEDESGRWVYVVRDGRVHRTEVKVAANNYVRAEIVDGLTDGELVVVGGKEELSDGARVRAVEGDGQ